MNTFHNAAVRAQRATRAFIKCMKRDPVSLAFTQCMVARNDVGNLCDDFDDGVPTQRGIKSAEKFIARARNWTPLAWWIWERAFAFRHALRCVQCELSDHIYRNHSHFTGDSGVESLSCARCGWSWSHTYY